MPQDAVKQDDRAPDALPQRRGAAIAAAVGLAAVLVGYGILKLYSFGPTLSDENIYYYMARATAERGVLPYRDYFFAHPPAHLVPLIVVALIFPHSYAALQAVPMVAGGVAAVFLFLLAYRTWGALAAVLTAGLFLFSRRILSGTSHNTGMDITVALVAIALYLALTERESWGGIVFALAGLSGIYALAGVGAIALVLALCGRRRLLPFAVGLLATWVGGNIAAWAIGGSAYWRDVYLYPMRVPPGQFGYSFGETVSMLTVFNFTIVWAAVIGVGLWIWQAAARRARQQPPQEGPEIERRPWRRALSEQPSDRVTAGALAYLAASVLFFATRGNLALYYFMLPFPGLALLGGRGAAQFIAIVWGAATHVGIWIWQAVARAPRQEAEARPAGPHPPAGSPRSLATASAALGLLAAGVGVRFWLGESATVQSILSTPARTYVWSDAPLIGPVNGVVWWLFWGDSSEPGRVYGAVREYLWLSSYRFDAALRIADYVRSNTDDDDTIFGDMLIAPLVALLADRRLAGDIADTSQMRFDAGIYTVEECWREIDRDRAVYIILPGPPAPSLADIPAFLDRLASDEFRIEREFRDPVCGRIALLRRVSEPTSPRPDR